MCRKHSFALGSSFKTKTSFRSRIQTRSILLSRTAALRSAAAVCNVHCPTERRQHRCSSWVGISWHIPHLHHDGIPAGSGAGAGSGADPGTWSGRGASDGSGTGCMCRNWDMSGEWPTISSRIPINWFRLASRILLGVK